MSLYRCIFCAKKSDDFDEFHHEPSEAEIKESGWSIEGSSYTWLVCNDCISLQLLKAFEKNKGKFP